MRSSAGSARDVIRTSLPETTLPNAEQQAYVLAVADGMGGAAFGELASILALRTGWDLGLDEVKWELKIDQDELRELKDKMRIVMERMDRALVAQMQANPRLQGMGTTCTIAYTLGLEAVIGHVGDSRAYLIRDGRTRRLTRDHTLAQDLADIGAIRQDEVDSHHLRHVLTNCLGGPGKGVDPDVFHLRLYDGDALLLCTDGLTETITDAEIASFVDRGSPPDAVCQALVNLANDRSGRDNITAVLGRYHLAR